MIQYSRKGLQHRFEEKSKKSRLSVKGWVLGFLLLLALAMIMLWL